MLPCNLRTWTRGQILFAMISILAAQNATTVPTRESSNSSATVANEILSTPNPPESNSVSVQNNTFSAQKSTLSAQNNTFNESSTASHVLTGPTIHHPTVSGPTSTTLNETNEPNNINSTQMQVSQETWTSNVTDSRDLTSQGSENASLTMTAPSTQAVQPPNSATTPQSTSSMEATMAPGSITCLDLGSTTSTSQMACFLNEDDTTCATLDEKKKEELRSFLCDIMNTTQCNVTIHSSEVQPKCILWVPTSKDAKNRLQDVPHPANSQLPAPVKWVQISDQRTRSQKTMIALVTCGVLLAVIILAGYFLSNRESWSPGRQRLGEDPYYTETDSQGNTLVSVSAHAQDKPNNGTRENGTGQTVSPTATNGHSTKKQTVSDTEL